jgi:hypothetical protein
MRPKAGFLALAKQPGNVTPGLQDDGRSGLKVPAGVASWNGWLKVFARQLLSLQGARMRASVVKLDLISASFSFPWSYLFSAVDA